MSEQKFKVGDTVAAAVHHPQSNATIMKGDLGVVVAYQACVVCVRWDKRIRGGHECGGLCEFGHGWNVYEDEVVLVDQQCVNIKGYEDLL